jgi:hypothetical protein
VAPVNRLLPRGDVRSLEQYFRADLHRARITNLVYLPTGPSSSSTRRPGR